MRSDSRRIDLSFTHVEKPLTGDTLAGGFCHLRLYFS
jgi:hypothetical protein